MFCSCLPSRQRDNLSSRALYPEQDSSGHEDCYSDNDDNDHDEDYSVRYPRALSYFQQQSQAEDPHHRLKDHQEDDGNPWPTSFSNGRLSKQANQSYEGAGGRQGGSRNYTRRPNPFRTFGNDKDLDNNEEGASGERNHCRTTAMTSFEPYRDDDDDDECDDENQTLLKGHHRSKILPKMDHTPFRIKTDDTHPSPQEVRAPTSMFLSSQPRSRPKSRPPRNPQGRMIWRDEEDGVADAEDILDVDALIAEQVREKEREWGIIPIIYMS